MSYTAFPTPACSPDPFDTAPVDASIRSKKEAGYVQTRPRFTRKLHTFGPITYPVLLAAEALAIKSHDEEVGSWGIFPWTNPETATVHQVRYSETSRPKFQRVGNSGLRSVTFTLEEA